MTNPKARTAILAFGALLTVAKLHAQSPEAVESIMVKVARNQDRALEMRSAFVYHQELLIRFKRSDGITCREETREFTVTPTPKGSEKNLTRFQGGYLKDKTYIAYTQPRYHYKELDLDGELITDFAKDFTDDQAARDGLASDLFPLTRTEQEKYRFTLKGTGTYHDRSVYKISFRPRPKTGSDLERPGDQGGEGCWDGELLVDATEYQPALVSTHLARGIPFWVKALLGTDVAHLGFKVAYARFGPNLWFPVEYGGEFKVKAVFFYKRSMALALHNNGFKRAEVTTALSYEEPFNSDDDSANPPPHETPAQGSTSHTSPVQ